MTYLSVVGDGVNWCDAQYSIHVPILKYYKIGVCFSFLEDGGFFQVDILFGGDFFFSFGGDNLTGRYAYGNPILNPILSHICSRGKVDEY